MASSGWEIKVEDLRRDARWMRRMVRLPPSLGDRVQPLSARSMLSPAGGTMVDWRGSRGMSEQRQDVYERVVSVEEKVDALAKSVDQQFESLAPSVDRRFDEVAAAFVEQRRYVSSAYELLDASISRLENKMDSGFARLDRKLDQLIARA